MWHEQVDTRNRTARRGVRELNMKYAYLAPTITFFGILLFGQMEYRADSNYRPSSVGGTAQYMLCKARRERETIAAYLGLSCRFEVK